MKGYYEIAGLSKQAYHKQAKKLSEKRDRTSHYLGLMERARQLHPVIGLAKIYYLFRPEGIGRQAFEQLGKLMGYALESRPLISFKGRRTIPYENLLSNKEFNAVNQVWVTDITYYKIADQYYYISMIMDLYIRKIISYGASSSLEAHHSHALLKKAIKSRRPQPNTLIHHSDKGSQYTSTLYINLLKKHDIGISMCSSVYENTNMERLNGIIKNDYLVHWNPRSLKQLNEYLTRAVNNYNNCPHGQLKMMSPNEYEQNLKNVPLSQRTKLKVFTFKRNKNFENPDQLQIPFNDLFFNQKGQPNLG